MNECEFHTVKRITTISFVFYFKTNSKCNAPLVGEMIRSSRAFALAAVVVAFPFKFDHCSDEVFFHRSIL